jgi:hypothetical protein
MFESWSKAEKIAGSVVAFGVAFVVYNAYRTSGKSITGPLTSPSLPVPPMGTPIGTPKLGTGTSYTVATQGTDLNVRNGPNSTSGVLATIKKGQVLQGTGDPVLGPGSRAGWLPITIVLPDRSMADGYVSLDFLQPTAQQTSAPQEPVSTQPLYKVTTGGAPLAVFDNPNGSSQNGTLDNGTLVYGTGATQGAFSQLLDPTSANLIAGWAATASLVLQPPAVSV